MCTLPSSLPSLVCLALCFALAPAQARAQAPANDLCANALNIPIPHGGFDYGVFSSAVSDLTTATGQTGEYFAFAPPFYPTNHTKSVWFEFTLPTRRTIKAELKAAPGSSLPPGNEVGLTVYLPSACVPAKGFATGSVLASGSLDNYCLLPGTYRIQVSAIASLSASVFVSLSLSCPSNPNDPNVSLYDCPDRAFVFNAGMPLPQGSVSSGSHSLDCHSVDSTAEYNCLPLPNKTEYLKSSWYVFTTGALIDLLAFEFSMGAQGTAAGYRLLEGNVRNNPPGTLTQIDCGVAKERFSTRYIEFPCVLKPNTTYSLALLFHKDFSYNSLNLTARQRGVTPTGWPKPVLPPMLAANQIGVLSGAGPSGTKTLWKDRFDCSARISKNPCPPANPLSGSVLMGTGSSQKTFDLATWATFTLTSDANVAFQFTASQFWGEYHTRIFSKTPGNNCPSPDPSPAADLYYEFSGTNGAVKCMPAGSYAIQVLSSVADPFPASTFHENMWDNGCLGTEFTFEFTVTSLPGIGKFMLDKPGEFEAINGLNTLQNNILYPSTPAVFVCKNTVLPDSSKCTNANKALYRQIKIGDANGDGSDDPGLLCISGLRTDDWPDKPMFYSFLMGNANQNAIAAGTHTPGQKIPGLSDCSGFCIDQDDNTFTPAGIDNFCLCLAKPGIYTLATLGNQDHVGKGDAPGFRFNILKTIHDSRANAEIVAVGAAPGTYTSQPDVFSCTDHLGNFPACGNRKKLVFREFFLPANTNAVVSIAEIGNTTSTLSLFSGRASDATANLKLIGGCATQPLIPLSSLINDCTPLPDGQWYTVVSYGEGPNYTDKKVWNSIGSPGDVGKTTRIAITLTVPILPKFNLPSKAHLAGITDWTSRPPANPNATTGKLFLLPKENFCAPDTPFIPNGVAPCAVGYNRVAFYVFEITKRSFLQIRGVDETFYTEVFPFDVKASPNALLTVPPVYQCLSTPLNYRQICDLPPGKYTLTIFANDTHKDTSVTPSLYVDAVGQSRFDHAAQSYDYGLFPKGVFVNGKAGDVPPIIGQHPSRDEYFCITGAQATDPPDTRCNTQLNPLIYAQPYGTPKPLFLPTQPAPPPAQPWRNLWYTFVLNGSGICTLRTNVLGGVTQRPLIAIYESDVNGSIPWATLQNTLGGVDSTLAAGLKLVKENVDFVCEAEFGDLVFSKSGCYRDTVRYFAVVTFAAYDWPNGYNVPNQVISLSLKYDPLPTPPPLYDERNTANVINGWLETQPPYTAQALAPGNTFKSADFSLVCYTKNATDPAGCSGKGKSAWFKFEVSAAGQFYAALEEIGVANGWFANTIDMTVWRESAPNGPLSSAPLPLQYAFITGEHEWLEGCISPGIYYLLVRSCSSMDTLQPYRVVLKLSNSPGDYCSNAIPVNVTNFTPASGSATVDCHSIGSDLGESGSGNSCFAIPGMKTTWFHAKVSAGPKLDISFALGENFSSSSIGLNHLAYRILAGTCGAMTPIGCSASGSNILTLNCLGPGDYYVQVVMPEKVVNTLVEGQLSLTVTAKASTDPTCIPSNPNKPFADFAYTDNCQSITFNNLSTAGTDISYLWQFPDGSTSNAPNPLWTPPAGSTSHSVTLTVTNTSLSLLASVTKTVTVSNPFSAYTPLPDGMICNGKGAVTLDATVPGAGYQWDNGSTAPTRTVTGAGVFSVKINKNGCEKRDTATVIAVNAQHSIVSTHCPNDTLVVGAEKFHANRPSGTVQLAGMGHLGCDSIVTVNLSFFPPAASALSQTICAGQGFLFDGINRTKTGIYKAILPSVHGCDSVVTLTLTVTPRQTIAHDTSGCTGASLTLSPTIAGLGYAWSNGPATASISVTGAGSFTVSISNAAGCIVGEEAFQVVFGALATPVVALPLPVCADANLNLEASGSSGQFRWWDAAVGGNLLGSGAILALTQLQSSQTVFAEAFSATVSSCTSQRVAVPITVLEKFSSSVAVEICFGQTFDFGGQILSSSGVYKNTFPAQNGCDSTVTLTLNIQALQTSTKSLIGCTGSVLTLSPPLPGLLYIWQDGSDNPTFSATKSDVYWVQSVGVNGCLLRADSFEVLFGALAQPLVSPAQTCTGNSTTLTASGSSGDFRWYDVPTGGIPLANGAVFSTGPLTADALYYVEAYQNGVVGCQSGRVAVPVSVEAPVAQVAASNFGGFGLPCFGGTGGSASVMLSGATLPIGYLWSTGDTGSLALQLSAGAYTVTATSARGCTATGSIVLNAPPDLSLTTTAQTDPSCFGAANGQITLTASGGVPGFEYSQDGTNFQSSPVFGQLGAAVFTLTARDANGCTKTVTATLTNPPELSLTLAKTNPNCFGAANGQIILTASGGVPGFEYSQDGTNFQSSPVFSQLGAAVFTLTARDANGCTKTTTATLTNPPELSLTLAKTNPSCFGAANGQIILTTSGGVPGFEYSQDGTNFQSSPVFSQLGAAVFTLTARDATGCTKTVTATLTNPPELSLTLAKTNPSCFEAANGQIILTASGGVPGFEYSQDGTNFQSSPVFGQLGAAVFTLTARDANGCTKTVTATLTTPPELSLTLAKTDPSCFGAANGQITLTASGGVPGFEYSRDGTNFLSSPVFSQLGAAVFTLTARDANGCTKTVTTTLTNPPELSLTLAKKDPSCFGAANGQITLTASGGVPGFEYSQDGTNFQFSPVFGQLGAAVFTLTARDANGCTKTVTATLTTPPELSLTIQTADPVCFGHSDGSIQAVVTGGAPDFHYSLNNGPTQPASVFHQLAAGMYQIVAEDQHGCRDSVQATLTAPPQLLLELLAKSPLCPGGQPTGIVSAAASGGHPPHLFALDQGPFSSLSDFKNLPPQLYAVTAQDAVGCEITKTVEVKPPVSLPLSLPPVQSLQWGDSVLLVPEIGFATDSLEWFPSEGLSCTNCLKPWAKPSKSINYQLRAWSLDGCFVSAQVQIAVKRELRIYVPNAIWPDGNGVNDEFTVFGGPEVRRVLHLAVYDRWGETVWLAHDFPADGSVGWDGRLRGKRMNPGVYVWTCELELTDGTKERLRGDVTLFR